MLIVAGILSILLGLAPLSYAVCRHRSGAGARASVVMPAGVGVALVAIGAVVMTAGMVLLYLVASDLLILPLH